MAFLELRLPAGQTRKTPLHEGANLVGSDPRAEVRLEDPLAAPQMAEITVRGDTAVIRALRPGLSAYLNGVPLAEGSRPLGQGDQLILGSTRFKFFYVNLEGTVELLELSRAETKPADAGTVILRPAAPPAPPPAEEAHRVPEARPTEPPVSEEDLRAWHHVEVLEGSGRGSVFLLKEKEVIVGRSPECHLRLADPAVSSRHAKIIPKPEGIFIVDMESRSGVYLNGRRVYRECLKDCDRLRLGDSVLVFHAPVQPPPPPSPEPAPAAPPRAAAAPGPAPPFAGGATSRPGKRLPWLALSFLLVALAVAGVAFLLAQRRCGKGDPVVEARVEKLLSVRDWDLAAKVLQIEGSAIPDDRRRRYQETISREKEASALASSCRDAMKRGEMDSAVESFFRLSPESVYRPEVADILVSSIEREARRALMDESAPPDLTRVVTLNEKILQIRPDYEPALSTICLARIAQGRYDEALGMAGSLLARNPRSPEGYYFKAQAFFRKQRPAEALAAVAEALKLEPDRADFLFLRAKAEIMDNRFDEARADLARVLEKEPSLQAARTLQDRLNATASAAAPGGSRPQPPPAVREAAAGTDASDGAEEIRRMQRRAAARATGPAPPAQPKPDAASGDRLSRARSLYREGKDVADKDMVAAVNRWEQMRSSVSPGDPPEIQNMVAEVAPRCADFLANRALADLRQNEASRAYLLALKALAWQPGHAGAAGVRDQVEDMARDFYSEGFRKYQAGDAATARAYWEKILALVTDASPWVAKAKEKLADLEEQK